MAKLTKEVVNTIFARMPDIRRFLPKGFTKQTAICPFIIVRGVTNNTEAGYQPQGAEPRDFTDFEPVIEGFDPIIVEWENGVVFPFDGTLDQRYKKAPKIKVRGIDGLVSEEPQKVYPIGSVFQYEDSKEFRLDKLENETDVEYQVRFKEALGDELDRLAKPENKKKDKHGREYYEQMHSKFYVKKFQTGQYFSAYFIGDTSSMVFKQWFGNETLQTMGIQKKINVLILNTDSEDIFPYVKADGFKGNRGFFDQIDKYRRVLWRIPEFDLTYDLENSTWELHLRNVSDGVKTRLELWIETLPGKTYDREIKLQAKHLENEYYNDLFIYYESYISANPNNQFINRPELEPNSDITTFILPDSISIKQRKPPEKESIKPPSLKFFYSYCRNYYLWTGHVLVLFTHS